MVAQALAGSGVPRRVLGRHLRGLRQQAGLTVKAAAGLLEWSEPKLWRIETGQTAMRGLDVTAMCTAYGAPAGLTRALAELARQVRAGGWWHAYGESIPDNFSVYAVLEDEASELLAYASCQVPALMRTEAYARTLIMARHPGASADEVDRLVGDCLARRLLVTRTHEPLTATVILNEALMRCPIGGAQVMAGQLRHLAGLAALPNVCLRVLPLGAGMHPGVMTGPFTLLRFRANGSGREADPDTVHVGGLTGELYLDKPHEVQHYDDAHAAILGCSLGQVASQDMLLTVAKEFQHSTA
jgi:Domain of unknown function (DUF5753)/Helix-turn-helix domain